MDNTQPSPWDIAKNLLVHYFRLTTKRSGSDWTKDNEAEIESIIDTIRAGVISEVKASKPRKDQP